MYPIQSFLEKVPRVPLLPGPTPLHTMRSFSQISGVTALIKRDDMTGIGPGGNKVRSLEFLLGDAIAQDCDVVLAAGPQQSNLCALTAAACARTGLSCELVFNSDEPARKEGNLLLSHILGTRAHFLGPCDGDTRNQYMEELAQTLRKQGRRPYVIRNGATTGRGALGYTAAALELLLQCQKQDIQNMTIFVPAGNGGMASGLVYGNHLLGRPFRVIVVSVEDDRETLTRNIGDTIRQAEEITNLPFDTEAAEAAEIVDCYRGGGWGQNTPESEAEIFSFARSEGIFIENVYNSKVLVGMRDYIISGKVHGVVCYLHSGGLGSLFAQY